MTKTLCVMLLALSFPAFSGDLEREEKTFSDRILKACELSIEVNLHDYEYGRYEMRMYSNNHFEDASLLTNEIEEACKIDPANKSKLSRVKVIFIKRGNIQERKLIQRKDGNLVYLANRVKAEQSRNKDDVIREDLVKVLKLSYVKPPDPKVEAKKIEEKKTEDLREKKQAEQKKKIDELTKWFQDEVKKITASPGPDMAPKLEALSKKYEEKLNALTTP